MDLLNEGMVFRICIVILVRVFLLYGHYYNCMSSLMESIREQRKVERRIVDGLKPIQEKTASVYLRTLLEIISMDSQKHMAICDYILEMMSGEKEERVSDYLFDSEAKNAFRQHVDLESSMIERLEGVEISDSRYRALVDYMLDEKRRHHKVLSKLYSLLEAGGKDMSEYYEIADDLMIRAHLTGQGARSQP